MTNHRPKLLFISLGCDKNRVDSEIMMGLLNDFGFTFTNNEYEAEIVIINSCCFIDSAKEETINTVLEMAKMKEVGSCICLIMAGCMSERFSDEIRSELPEVDGLIGTSDLRKIIEVVRDCYISAGGVLEEESCSETLSPIPPRILSTGSHFAYLKIADGCNRCCTYCIIPSIRGSYVSYPMDLLLERANHLASLGVRELILVAQETTFYGVDLYGKRMLPELLANLCKIDGFKWIRLLYTYPEEITDELLKVIACEPKICKYIDLPIQHCSNEILKRMGRNITGQEIAGIIKKIRKTIPGIALRTSLISGFPGETDKDHKELLEFVSKIKFDHLGVFAYSQEEGTKAALMPDQIEEDIKKQRRDNIMKLQLEISASRLRKLIGKTFDVLIEGRIDDKNLYVGRTYMDAPDVDSFFYLKSDKEYFTGDFLSAVVCDSLEYDLIGEVL